MAHTSIEKNLKKSFAEVKPSYLIKATKKKKMNSLSSSGLLLLLLLVAQSLINECYAISFTFPPFPTFPPFSIPPAPAPTLPPTYPPGTKSCTWCGNLNNNWQILTNYTARLKAGKTDTAITTCEKIAAKKKKTFCMFSKSDGYYYVGMANRDSRYVFFFVFFLQN